MWGEKYIKIHRSNPIGCEAQDSSIVDQYIEFFPSESFFGFCHGWLDARFVGSVELDENHSPIWARNQGFEGWWLGAWGCDDSPYFWGGEGEEVSCERETETAGAACYEICCHGCTWGEVNEVCSQRLRARWKVEFVNGKRSRFLVLTNFIPCRNKYFREEETPVLK